MIKLLLRSKQLRLIMKLPFKSFAWYGLGPAQ